MPTSGKCQPKSKLSKRQRNKIASLKQKQQKASNRKVPVAKSIKRLARR